MTTALKLAEPEMRRIARYLRKTAHLGVYDGLETPANRAYMAACTVDYPRLACRVIFTRDIDHHASGWLKNPDYDRCWHLSISVQSRIIRPGIEHVEVDRHIEKAWVEHFFHDDVKLIWRESAKSRQGIRLGVVHWRLFCDPAWNPILPRGEVYSTKFTELGWKSASHVFEESGKIIGSVVDPN